ncbi:MAG: DNA topoisomerase I [Promethearchaeota archaeon]
MKFVYLIIAEKPAAAIKIATALDNNGKPIVEKSAWGKEWFQITLFDSLKKAIIISAVGHLFTLAKVGKKQAYPTFDFEWKKETRRRYSNQYINTINEVLRRYHFEKYIVATDLDIEGSVIGYNILRFLVFKGKARISELINRAFRMQFSTLTKKELRDSWRKLGGTPNLDCPRIEAGYTRHWVDILFGINLSDALTTAAKSACKRFKLFSIGRVQGPTLKAVYERDKEIENHVPIPYWVLDVNARIRDTNVNLEMKEKRFDKKLDAIKIKDDCEGRSGSVTKIKESDHSKPAPPPFCLSSLQSEASRLFKFKPSLTLKLAEKLYLDALITYPRTSSEIIPDTINVKDILTSLASIKEYQAHATMILGSGRLKPSQGKKSDPAHPPILPTGNDPHLSRLSKNEMKLFDLVTKRFFVSFGSPLKWKKMIHEITVNTHGFKLINERMVDPGWTKYYGNYFKNFIKEKLNISLNEGEVVDIISIEILEKFTQPPPHYSDITLLKYMENVNIGTKSTRADIIEKLKNRKYITSDPIKITDIGKTVIEVFDQYVPDIISLDLTRNLECDIEAIMDKKLRMRNVLDKARKVLIKELAIFKNSEKKIGERLCALIENEMQESKKLNRLGMCPACKKYDLILVRKKNKKRFVACEGYFTKECTVTLPIIQTGRIYPTKKICPACGYPIVKHYGGKGKKPWNFCLNWANCPATKPQKTKKTGS